MYIGTMYTAKTERERESHRKGATSACSFLWRQRKTRAHPIHNLIMPTCAPERSIALRCELTSQLKASTSLFLATALTNFRCCDHSKWLAHAMRRGKVSLGKKASWKTTATAFTSLVTKLKQAHEHSSEELEQICRNVRHLPDLELPLRVTVANRRVIENFFSYVDLDGGGDISVVEFMTALRVVGDRLRTVAVSSPMGMFAKLDANQSGTLSCEELVQGIIQNDLVDFLFMCHVIEAAGDAFERISGELEQSRIEATRQEAELDHHERLEVLSQIDEFACFDANVRNILARMLKRERLWKGSILLGKGDVPRTIYFMVSGRCVARDDTGQNVPMTSMGVGIKHLDHDSEVSTTICIDSPHADVLSLDVALYRSLTQIVADSAGQLRELEDQLASQVSKIQFLELQNNKLSGRRGDDEVDELCEQLSKQNLEITQLRSQLSAVTELAGKKSEVASTNHEPAPATSPANDLNTLERRLQRQKQMAAEERALRRSSISSIRKEAETAREQLIARHTLELNRAQASAALMRKQVQRLEHENKQQQKQVKKLVEQLSAAQGSAMLRSLHTKDKHLGAGSGNGSPGASIQAPAEPGVPKARFDRLTELNHLMIGKVEKLRSVSACAEAAAPNQRLHVFFVVLPTPRASPRIHLTWFFRNLFQHRRSWQSQSSTESAS